MLYKRKIIEKRLNIKKKIDMPINIANKIFHVVIGRAIVRMLKRILKTILINKQSIFLHNIIRVYPLSEVPKIVIIRSERSARISEKASIIINSENAAKK